MAQPGSSVTKFIRRRTAAGAASTGKVLADFSITGLSKAAGGSPATFTTSSTITEISGGFYAWTYTLPAAVCDYGLDIDVATGTDSVDIVSITDELEANDLDAIAASVSRPIVTVTGQGTLGQITPVSLANKRYRVIRFAFVDEAGAAIDMTTGTTYTSYKWCVRAYPDQTTAPPKLDATNGLATAAFSWVITGGVGYVDVKVPEDATIFGSLTEGASAVDTIECRHELIADLVALPNETVALVQSSPLYIGRREGGT